MGTRGRVRVIVWFIVCLSYVAGSGAIWSEGAVADPGQPKLAKSADFSLLIKPDGSLWAWGYNASGQLGIGTTTLRPVAWRVGTATDWATVAGGQSFSLGLKTDGSLWSWGDDTYGQLGLGDSTMRTVPTRVGTAGDWAAIACGDFFALAVKRDGSLWAWGQNSYGQLGVGDLTNRSVPVRVGTDSDWQAMAGGINHVVALKQNGSLWSWGRNNRGQLGRTGTASQVTPARIGTDVDWVAVDCGDQDSRAKKADGSLWAWGYNSYGQLGQGDTTSRSVPARVGDSSAWSVVTCGDDHTAALRTDGGLWEWGDNTYGQLGLGDTSARSLPVRIGIDSDWTAIACGDDDTAALKADGSLWTWGHNHVGQLGQADFANRGTPTFAFNVADSVAPTLDSLGSPTHPEAAAWYSSNSPAFAWTYSDPSGIGGYRFLLDQSAGTTPSIAYPSFAPAASYSGKSDGVWYFHVRALDRAGNWGATTTRQVRIDTTAPVTTQTGADDAWHLAPVTVTFAATDARSGVAATEYQVDSGSWIQGGSVTVTTDGEHTVTYRSRDNAGNVEADKTCVVKIQPARTYAITPSAGAHGSVSPATVQTVAAGADLTVTIVPDVGYHIANVLVDGASVGAVASYTFSIVSADHNLVASFAADGTLVVVGPNGGESLPAGVPITVTWSSPPAAGGSYRVWALSQGGTYYNIGTFAADGSSFWAKPWSVSAPAGSYRIRVSYMPAGSTSYSLTDYSDAYFTVTPGATVLSPNGGESLPAGVPITVTWSSPPAAGGSYRVWALSQGGTYYNIGTFAADGSSFWAKPWSVSAPAGSYRIRVSYMPAGSTSYSLTDYSDAYFTVTTP